MQIDAGTKVMVIREGWDTNNHVWHVKGDTVMSVLYYFLLPFSSLNYAIWLRARAPLPIQIFRIRMIDSHMGHGNIFSWAYTESRLILYAVHEPNIWGGGGGGGLLKTIFFAGIYQMRLKVSDEIVFRCCQVFFGVTSTLVHRDWEQIAFECYATHNDSMAADENFRHFVLERNIFVFSRASREAMTP